MKQALITGASSGIGAALAVLLAEEGIDLILTGRNQEALQALSDRLSSKVKVDYLTADLSNPDSRKTILEKIEKETPDLIINNAGIGYTGEAISHPVQDQLDVVEVNIKALLEITLESARHLKAQGRPGTVLNVSSVVAHFIFPLNAVYSSTKAFVNHLSEALDIELAPYHIRVLAACPGSVDTNFSIRSAKGKPKQKRPSTWLSALMKPMSAETAARYILKQLNTKKRVMTFNPAFLAFSWLARLLPHTWTYAYFKKRYAHVLKKD